VLAYGEWTDPATLDAIPENFLIAPTVPQLDVLTRTQVFITPAG
jgi:UDP:flavonoid glycosyltransferase YjiC (YdhE family)